MRDTEFGNDPEEYAKALLEDLPRGNPGISRESLNGQSAYVSRNGRGRANGVVKFDDASITDIAVDPALRRRGIAGALCRRVADEDGIHFIKGPFSDSGRALTKAVGLHALPRGGTPPVLPAECLSAAEQKHRHTAHVR